LHARSYALETGTVSTRRPAPDPKGCLRCSLLMIDLLGAYQVCKPPQAVLDEVCFRARCQTHAECRLSGDGQWAAHDPGCVKTLVRGSSAQYRAAQAYKVVPPRNLNSLFELPAVQSCVRNSCVCVFTQPRPIADQTTSVCRTAARPV
jgi:hypothetical protein